MQITVKTSRRPANMMKLKIIFSNPVAEPKCIENLPNEGPTLLMQVKAEEAAVIKSLPEMVKAMVPIKISVMYKEIKASTCTT